MTNLGIPRNQPDTKDPRVLLSLARTALDEGMEQIKTTDPQGYRSAQRLVASRVFAVDRKHYVVGRVNEAMHLFDTERYPKLALMTIGRLLGEISDALAAETENDNAQEAACDLSEALDRIDRVIDWL